MNITVKLRYRKVNINARRAKVEFVSSKITLENHMIIREIPIINLFDPCDNVADVLTRSDD